MNKEELKNFIRDNKEEMFKTLKELCLIPAPSHFEQKRAEYCKNWLENVGAKDVYIDKALNVIFPLNCEGSSEITVFAAHTDTVFPDMEPLPYREDGDIIYCPGVGDDTASVTVLLMIAKYFLEKGIAAPRGVMFVCNSCEEGLGNLKGTRQLFSDFEGRIARFVTLDSTIDTIADRCAGSHRYEVEVKTEGGHSYQKFGNANAIAELSKIITEIYKLAVPEKEGARTTYNVGSISGGTSVNTIAQSAKMLCEYRSNDRECLEIMQKNFKSIFESARSEKVQVEVTQVGDRPCANIDYAEIEKLKEVISPLIEETIGKQVLYKLSSTDCNIPLSIGIPAICIGVCENYGAHTREEWIKKSSLIPGLEIAVKVAAALTE